jgi:hypothetical protein
MDRVFRALLNGTGDQGVLKGWLNELEVTDPVVANTVYVDTGSAIVYGLWYENDASVSVNIPNGPRTDLIVVRRSWAAQTARITRIAGPGAAVTQNPGVTYDIPLAEVTVDVAGTITLITDVRDYCEYSTNMQDGAITTDSLQTDAVTPAKILNQTRWISRGINTMEADGTNPATLTYAGTYDPYAVKQMPWRPYWSFATGAYNSVWITFQVPVDFVAGGAMTVYVWTQRVGFSTTYLLSIENGYTTDMRWGFSSWRAAAGGVLANDTGAATITYPERITEFTTPSGYTYDIPQSWRYTERDSIGTFSPAAGDIVHMEVYRDGAHGGDIYGYTAALFMVEISYTADS